MNQGFALLIIKNTEWEFDEGILHKPLDTDRATVNKLARDLMGLLRSVGFRRGTFTHTLEPTTAADPDPISFGRLGAAGQSLHPGNRRLRIKVGTNGHVFTTKYLYDRAQVRHVKDMLDRIFDTLNMDHAVKCVR